MHPGDLKAAVELSLNTLLAPIRQKFSEPALQELTAAAYPPLDKKGNVIKKKEKKVKPAKGERPPMPNSPSKDADLSSLTVNDAIDATSWTEFKLGVS